MTVSALANAVAATAESPFLCDLASAVANDGTAQTAARWLWALLDDGRGPIRTFDSYIWTVEALGRTWPCMQEAAAMFAAERSQIARFIADRIAAAVNDQTTGSWHAWMQPASAAVVLAERAHDIAAFFSVDLKPNGSKDPFALRRSAKHFIIASRFSHTGLIS